MKAFVFPGQGSQAIGMGKIFYDTFASSRQVFEEVDEALGQKLSTIIFEGPESDLVLTENAQPALMSVSLAMMAALEKDAGVSLANAVQYVAGHSLGEYSALAAAKALSIGDTARLLKIRGQSMQKAVPVGQGAMAAILGLEITDVHSLASQAALNQVCVVANDNCPGQIVISGNKEAVERSIDLAKELGAKRSILLNVSAPFHCPLMQPAADRMKAALQDVTIQKPLVPVITNVRATPCEDPETIRELLVEQVTGMVRWRESVQKMASLGVTQIIEIGAGQVLTGLTKRIDKDVISAAINSPEDLEGMF
ncbi:ACP S-malonyltransferase [Candidatus Bealeia paramacronuclearis]|uniref:Malonyl CoA-acyl carrier protein transacylase n=1 Tax=Candidatus Bealeia paramacronuclearis TaxID=1921001 RepID=A0ABZ2C2S9_9PROT|nr:ACP S-malonyltransferase [Candidatus Bealeia paramacronuclearis]